VFYFSGVCEKHDEWDGALNSRFIAGCVKNICAKNSLNMVIRFKVTIHNVSWRCLIWATLYKQNYLLAIFK